jgi:hypothetical protein
VYMREKEKLLWGLTEGNTILYHRAVNRVKEYYFWKLNNEN